VTQIKEYDDSTTRTNAVFERTVEDFFLGVLLPIPQWYYGDGIGREIAEIRMKTLLKTFVKAYPGKQEQAKYIWDTSLCTLATYRLLTGKTANNIIALLPPAKFREKEKTLELLKLKKGAARKRLAKLGLDHAVTIETDDAEETMDIGGDEQPRGKAGESTLPVAALPAPPETPLRSGVRVRHMTDILAQYSMSQVTSKDTSSEDEEVKRVEEGAPPDALYREKCVQDTPGGTPSSPPFRVYHQIVTPATTCSVLAGETINTASSMEDCLLGSQESNSGWTMHFTQCTPFSPQYCSGRMDGQTQRTLDAQLFETTTAPPTPGLEDDETPDASPTAVHPNESETASSTPPRYAMKDIKGLIGDDSFWAQVGDPKEEMFFKPRDESPVSCCRNCAFWEQCCEGGDKLLAKEREQRATASLQEMNSRREKEKVSEQRIALLIEEIRSLQEMSDWREKEKVSEQRNTALLIKEIRSLQETITNQRASRDRRSFDGLLKTIVKAPVTKGTAAGGGKAPTPAFATAKKSSIKETSAGVGKENRPVGRVLFTPRR
jgi:hypothetical protein